eukprot:2105690-Pyramimonas_sp.AAC.1
MMRRRDWRRSGKIARACNMCHAGAGETRTRQEKRRRQEGAHARTPTWDIRRACGVHGPRVAPQRNGRGPK